ncbi:N-alpha-acetyltransferase 38, NatC auxiliary subunit isoform X1 [Oncorhynchus tshawytscha]|uniref:Sm domain-containing protein n=1 Tax=Oncorhynchus tshawytscha TaxID=74940 RepID=A0AAZ3R224_ONCTS|nr:N-alpha-acetyltransferase 38, NatC auxiliary subunit isoform X1 [Oncorhynchus tshawytscha]
MLEATAAILEWQCQPISSFVQQHVPFHNGCQCCGYRYLACGRKSFNLLDVTVGIVGQFEVQHISHPWIEGQSELSSSSSRVRQKLESLLNKNMRIRMTDGRTLVGLFLCTDRDCNVILGSAQEFLKSSDSFSQGEPRVLGLAMIPGHHVVSIEVESDTLADTHGFGGSH